MSEELLAKCFNQPFEELESLFDEAYKVSRINFSNLIHFYVPGMVHYDIPFYKSSGTHGFPGISVTGRSCQLNCEHCSGKLLESMIPATTPKELYDVCMDIKDKGGNGCLISGGSLYDGTVPLIEFIPTIKRIKQELKLKVVMHTGLIYPDVAEELANAGIDAAMLDIIGSNETIRDVYHLDYETAPFEQSLSLLEHKNIPTVPHIVVGIHFGQIKGERQAVTMISRYHPAAIVIVALMPMDHTPMERVVPPSPLEIARVVLAERLLMPTTPLLLGCARPRGLHKIETDTLAIKAGVNGIAYPSEEACNLVKEMGLDFAFHQQCCSLMWQVFS